MVNNQVHISNESKYQVCIYHHLHANQVYFWVTIKLYSIVPSECSSFVNVQAESVSTVPVYIISIGHVACTSFAFTRIKLGGSALGRPPSFYQLVIFYSNWTVLRAHKLVGGIFSSQSGYCYFYFLSIAIVKF